MESLKPLAPNPAISIIVVAGARLDWLEATLRRLDTEPLDAPVDLVAVVAVDVLPRAETLVAARHGRAVGTPAGTTPAAARSVGLQAATGDLLLFLDADIDPLPGAIRRHLELHEPNGRLLAPSLVVGPALPGLRPRFAGRSPSPSIDLDQLSHPDRRFRYDGLLTGIVSLRARALAAVGGFHERFEDRSLAELGIRILERDGRVLFSPAAGGVRRVDLGIAGRLARRVREGRADTRLATQYPELWDRLRLSRAGTGHRGRRALHGLAIQSPWLAAAAARVGQFVLAQLERAEAWSPWQRLLGALDYLSYWTGIATELGGGSAARRRLRELARRGKETNQRDLDREIEIDLTPIADSGRAPPASLTRPRVSVIIAAYQAADTLGETLASLAAQTDPRWEAIVIDDGSTDETSAIAATWATRDPRFRIVRRTNGGPGEARNTGLYWSRAEWVLFLDADDWIAPTWLAKAVETTENDPALDGVHCGWVSVRSDGLELAREQCRAAGDLFDEFSRRCAFAIHACVVRRRAVDQAGGFDPGWPLAEDWILWQRITRRGARFARLPEALAFYRRRPTSLSADPLLLCRAGLRAIDLAHGPDPAVGTGPDVRHPEGADPSARSGAIMGYSAWAAGARLALGGSAVELADLVAPEAIAPAFDLIAECVAQGAPLAIAAPPPAWTELWNPMLARLDAYLEALERRSALPGTARAIRSRLERRVTDLLPNNRPWSLGVSRAIRLEVFGPIAEIGDLAGIDCLRVDLHAAGDRIGQLELPVVDGVVGTWELREAIADRFAWVLLGRYFRETLWSGLEFRSAEDGLSAWLGPTRLAGPLPEDPARRWTALHDAAGWAAFERATWGVPLRIGPAITPRTGEIAEIDLVDGVPSLVGIELPVTAEIRLAGLPLFVARFTPREYATPSDLRSAIASRLGFQLCRVIVREAIVGRELGGESLLERLAARRSSRGGDPSKLEAPAVAALSPGWPAAIDAAVSAGGEVILGHPVTIDRLTPARRVAYPREAEDLVRRVADADRAPVVRAGADSSGRLFGSPELIGLAPDLDPTPPRPEGPTIPTPSIRSKRFEFEALFAQGVDLWQSASAYEQTKYEQTLRLLPAGPIRRAFEIGCAEGHFTRQLAPRVEHLLAGDISQVAADRTASRCRDRSNVEVRQFDLAADPMPGSFDLIVCSEMLYYLDNRAALVAIARKLATGLTPGGSLISANGNTTVDDPSHTGFDWDVEFGAATIAAVFAETPGLRVVTEFRTPLYRILHCRRDDDDAPPTVIESSEYAMPAPDVAAQIRWGGEQRPRSAADRDAGVTVLRYGGESLGRGTRLEEQLRFLASCGFRSVRLDDLRSAADRRRGIDGRPLLLTFDQSLAGFAAETRPLLEQFGFQAVCFVSPADCGDADSATALVARGIELGVRPAGTMPATGFPPNRLLAEALEARAAVEEATGQSVSAWAYARGDEDEIARRTIGAAGFELAFTLRAERAWWHDPLLALPRIAVAGTEDLASFIPRLAAGRSYF